MLSEENVITGGRKCLNCLYPRELSKTLAGMGLYYCDEDKIKGENYGHPVLLSEKACRCWQPICSDFNIKLKIVRQYVLYYCIDQNENVWAFSKNDDCCLIKALNNIRKSFLIEKSQMKLFEKDGDLMMLIKIAGIKIGKRMRKLDENKVNELVQSIAEIGLINPITINQHNELLAGAHRLEAMKRLGLDSIYVVIKNNVIEHGLNKGLYDALIEIDENLLGPQLTALERADFLKERKRIYEILHPETKQGQSQASAMNKIKDDNVTAENAVTFTKDASEKTGLAERTIREDVQLSNSLSEEAKKIITGTWIEDKKTYLMEIGKLCPESQVQVAKRLIEFPALSLDWAVKKIEAERYGLHLSSSFLIDLEKSTLHLYNSGLPIDEQKRVINLVASNSYPPFITNDLYNISGKQDDLVNEVLGIEKNQEDPTKQLAEKELIELGVKMPKRNDKKIVPVMILPDGNKRILSHLADNTFLSALVNKEMLARVDICLNDNDAILIRRVGNLLSVSKASINSERFIEELNKSFEQIKE